MHAIRNGLGDLLLGLLIGLLLAAAIGCPLPTHAQDAGSTPRTCSRVLTVAASPLGKSIVISEKGEVSGVTVQVMERVAAEAGCQIQWVVVPRSRAFFQLGDGSIDLVTDAIRTPQRDEGARFVESGSTVPALVSLRSKPAEAESIEALRSGSLRLIVIRGYDFGPGYRALLQDPAMANRITEASSPETAFKMLLNGRANAILTAPSTLIDTWEREGQNEPLRIAEVRGMPALPFGLYMSDWMEPQDRIAIERALLKVIRQGDVERMSASVYPPALREAMRPLIKIKR
jgi:polar amino acid transport system substrate-binding protein